MNQNTSLLSKLSALPLKAIKGPSKNCFLSETERNRRGQGGREKSPEAVLKTPLRMIFQVQRRRRRLQPVAAKMNF